MSHDIGAKVFIWNSCHTRGASLCVCAIFESVV